MLSPSNTRTFPVKDYDLGATLSSGQAFRWRKDGESWVGVIGTHWLRLRSDQFSITAETAEPLTDWSWLTDYLQLDLDLTSLMVTFPKDEPMRAAANACRGLRLLRQDPWECLASFILSSTKQIVQIRQIIELLCQRFGEPISSRRAPACLYFPNFCADRPRHGGRAAGVQDGIPGALFAGSRPSYLQRPI